MIGGVASDWRNNRMMVDYQRTMSSQDNRMILRLVGFWEYVHALANLDELLAQIDEDQRAAIDDYIRDRGLYDVQVNLSAKLERGLSSVAGREGEQQPQRGLDWLLALARVELGAMLAGFTDHPQPFEAVRPSDYDLSACKSLLLDGVRFHYWSLVNDPDLNRVLSTSQIASVLSYSRRAVVVRTMLRAVLKSGVRELNPIQIRELISWKESLDGIQGTLSTQIRTYLAAESHAGSQASAALRLACESVLHAEQREAMATMSGRTRTPSGP